ncbi:MAG: ABC transporter ATP-binding protein, partial [Burkholderiaceae bacterium]|nr:ABC transporter ATP-binding protein [Burkholderiaceae bacterium]
MVEHSVLRIDDLHVSAGRGADAPAILKGISLSIAAGETLCLVGESGSGKSVTSLATMGLLPKNILVPKSGRILLEGQDILTRTERQIKALRTNRMAMIFQEPMTALNPVMPVGRQIEEVLQAHTRLGASERRKKVLDMLDQVHLPEIERVYRSFPHQLSGGQRQRIMIAMALVLQPKLLIADEPTTALDVTTQKEILRLIEELQTQHGTSVLFITHDMGVVADIADRVCVMHHGNIVETAAIDDLLRTPKTDYTRKLLSAVPSLIARPARPERSAEIVLEAIELNKTYGVRG